MSRDEQWLATIIAKAETVDECKLAVTQFLVERQGRLPRPQEFGQLRIVPSEPMYEKSNR